MTQYTTRSHKSAEAKAAEMGLAAGTYTIEKMGTAKYVLDVPEESQRKPRTTKVNLHWNDDGSATLYVRDRKFRRVGGEDASEDEQEDPEGCAERILNRQFPRKTGGWSWGRVTSGHNWHTKRQKALRQAIADGEAAGTDVAELREELARISGKAA